MLCCVAVHGEKDRNDNSIGGIRGVLYTILCNETLLIAFTIFLFENKQNTYLPDPRVSKF